MKILYLINNDKFFCSHFLERAIAAKAKGYEVIVASGEGGARDVIINSGLEYIDIPLKRSGINPFKEFFLILFIFNIYKKTNPDIVHHITLKPIIYGSLVSVILKIKFIVNAPVGMGYVFSSSDFKAKVLKYFILFVFRFLLNPSNSRVIFENSDDLNFFIKNGSVKSADACLIRGAGIDLIKFKPSERLVNPPKVVLVARMLKDKGVLEFVSAAKIIRNSGLQVKFVLVGEPDPGNPASISLEDIKIWVENGLVEWWGHRNDIAEILTESTIACLPSYREGLPKSLLEAAASGLPIVTTDAVGCREVVKDGYNGYLVPIGNSLMLAGAIEMLIKNFELRKMMGRNSRLMAESEFDSELIINQTLQVYNQSNS